MFTTWSSGNPPYQGTALIQDAEIRCEKQYTVGKADLFAAFLLRGLDMVCKGGTSAMLTMRSWMFTHDYRYLRPHLLRGFDLRAIGDFEVGAFEEVSGVRVSVSVAVFRRVEPANIGAVVQRLTLDSIPGPADKRTHRKRAATLCHVGNRTFIPDMLNTVPGWPLVYWWSIEDLDFYNRYPKIGDSASVRQGLATGNNPRFLRKPWEVSESLSSFGNAQTSSCSTWVPYIKGAAGARWFESLADVLKWAHSGLEKKVCSEFLGAKGGNGTPSEHLYFRLGVAFSPIGSNFTARAHRYPSVIGHTASSVFGVPTASCTCLLNNQRASKIAEDLNPGAHFEVGDVKRLPLFDIEEAPMIFSRIDSSFAIHETHRETSVEFRRPGPSPWHRAQVWAQSAVNRAEGEPLPPYEPECDPEPPTDHLSFALGVALGRFGPKHEGILDPAKDDLTQALPAGILFLDGSLESNDLRDDLGHDAAGPLHTAWAEYGRSIDGNSDLRDYLRTQFFEDVHRKMYESRPIHWPLSSERKTFVAWVTIHRWNEGTLRVLLADHLLDGALKRLDGEITDLRVAREGADKKVAREAEKRYAKVQKWREELVAFIAAVEQCAEQGPPPIDAACPPREVNARYNPDLDDGVIINSAALWPLLVAQWKEPKKWWKELASAKGKKDYDWSHLAMRYWPTRVDAKCQTDPSFGVAHGCFWKYHPARAWAWELRLQDEIGPDFRIEEAHYRGDGGHEAHRAAFLLDHADEALAAIEKEALRRRKKRKAPVVEFRILEPGLWSHHPEACYALELRLIEKQGAGFLLLSPDETHARAAYESEYPEQVDRRRKLLESVIVPEMFPADDDEDSDDDEDLGDEAMDDADEAEVTT